MMIKLKNKSNVRVIALMVAAVFVLGVVGIALTQSQSMSRVSAAPASNSTIGVVNYQVLFEQHPDTAKAQATMQQEAEQARKDFDAKSASMNEKEKQDYAAQLQQKLSNKQMELRGAILEKIDAVIKQVAEEQGLSVVMDNHSVVYGGKDITEAVSKKMK